MVQETGLWIFFTNKSTSQSISAELSKCAAISASTEAPDTAEQQIPAAVGDHLLTQKLIITVIAAVPCQGKGNTTGTDQGCESGMDSETENLMYQHPLCAQRGKQSLFLKGDKDAHSHSSGQVTGKLTNKKRHPGAPPS